VIEKESARLECAVRDTEVFVQSLDAHVLDHANARDLVERLVAGQRSIIANLDRH
jgi:hypothetical protein